ncbi:histone H3.v1-like [Limanda limanda]|uniref:histone H3.v1-like n=1 Tax=Limanda limanda TaxID=27771 RepID=UPI0029C6488C|nr:histone H3.v1-like [Limanda limanda]
MMSKKTPQCSAADQSEHDQPQCQVDRPSNAAPGCRNQTESGQRNEETASSSPESGSTNGDGKRGGKSRRRKKRSSNPEGGAGEKADSETKTLEKKPQKKARQPSEPRAALTGLQSECGSVWFERSVYERAESLYQCWLAGSSSGTTQSNRSPPAPSKHPNSPSTAAPSVSGAVCHHGDQVVCPRVVEEPSVPISLDLPSPPDRSTAPRTPDEGYQSLAPTPATPVTPVTPVLQQAAVTPASRQSINGLPRFPVELLREVWLEKPLFDRAEAAFYQNLYGNNSSKRSSCASSSRNGEHPQSLVEEEEEEEEAVAEVEEEEEEEEAVEEKRAVQPGKAEIFHALHPIQEEEEPAEVPEKEEASGVGGVCHFLHPDSERVWLDKWRYDAAESRFHGYSGDKAVVVGKKGRRPEADASAAASTAPLGDNTMNFLAQEKIWFDKPRYDEAERRFYENMNGSSQPAQDAGANSILKDIARARENIQKSLAGSTPTSTPTPTTSTSSSSGAAADQGEVISRINSLELENQSLHKVVDNLRAALSKLEIRVAVLEESPVTSAPAPSAPYTNGTSVQQKTSAPEEQKEEEEDEEEDDDDIDLFGSEDDEEAENLKQQRLKEYAEKKSKKPTLIAKSCILLDVKPWDDETDMGKLEECVRSVQADGLLWGTSKLVAVGYGIKKLQITCVVEDDKVGTDLLEEEITKFEDFIQSVDVAAFNKI